ncbi:MAG: secondary thiamine-phosphate synthase enzyme YjbQ [Ignavibacteria bacterium]|nr:secondary thiamine-phosphate synthase enzyme YjbQ [Ignavibacteria bacterium]
MKVFQKEFSLKPRPRGFHIITDEILSHIPELKETAVGLCSVFIKHTSASLSINENADPSVRTDMETHFNIMVPEDADHYEHSFEGPDDMTSHIKTSILGSSLNIPVTGGKLNLGTWQGIYLCEHRNHGGSRKLVVTLMGI